MCASISSAQLSSCSYDRPFGLLYNSQIGASLFALMNNTFREIDGTLKQLLDQSYAQEISVEYLNTVQKVTLAVDSREVTSFPA